MIAYLDNSATTRVTEPAVAAMVDSMRGGYFNPSSLYAPAMNAERALNDCRRAIARAVHAPDARVIFTSGGTEGNNLAVLGAVSAMRGTPHAITSSVEHPSVAAACKKLEAAGHRVTVIGVDPSGELDWAALEAALEAAPALVSLMQVNNETGAILDVPRLSRLVRALAPGALIHVDGVQGFLRVPFDARLVDMYTVSAHKIGGPKGAGALVARKGVRLIAQHVGGGQEQALRAGTENTPGIAGMLAAVNHMPPDAAERMMALKMRLLNALKAEVPGLVVNGPAPETAAPHIVNVSFPFVRGETLLHALEGQGVYCSTGSACSSKGQKVSAVLTAMGIKPNVAEGALRFSLCPDTTEQEVDYAASQAGACYASLAKDRRR